MWQSAPRLMKVAKRQAACAELQHLKPICNLEVLTDAFTSHTAWFEQLRQDDGLRDILVHKPHVLQIAPEGTSSPGQDGVDWRIVAHLVRHQPKLAGGLSVIDLFPELLRCVDGACVFMSRFVAAIGSLRDYEQGDCVLL